MVVVNTFASVKVNALRPSMSKEAPDAFNARMSSEMGSDGV